MGLISAIKKLIKKRKEQQKIKLLEDATTKALNDFVEKFVQTELIEDEKEKNIQQEMLVKGLEIKVKAGIIDLGGTPEDRINNPLSIVERHFKRDKEESAYKVCGVISSMKKDELGEAITSELLKSDLDVQKIDRLLMEYIELTKTKDDHDFMRSYSDKEKHDILVELAQKYRGEHAKYCIRNIRAITLGKYINKIEEASNIQEQQRLYEEYVDGILGGQENPEDYMMLRYKNAPFIIQREQKRKCDKYGIEYDPNNPVIIYEATPENKESIVSRNRELATKKLKEPVTTKDLVLVRTTNFLPRHRLVEPVGQHSMPLLDGTFFEQEVKEAGLNMDDYNMAAFVTRGTTHWALNGLVGSHDGGNFANRNYIIIEPFEEQEDNEGLMNIDEADTYFNQPVKLSKRATILIPVEKYKEMSKDPEQMTILSEYNIRVFVGDEEQAVTMFLNEQGYVTGGITKWGFTQSIDSPEDEYCSKLEEQMEDMASSKENVTYCKMHYGSETWRNDRAKRIAYMDQRLDRFARCLFEHSGVQFSEQYLKAMFMSRMVHWDEEHYEKYYEEYLEKTPELEGVKHMSPSEVFEAIGPERVKEITKIYNDMIYEEHRRAREARDKELIEQGLLTQEQLEKKTVVQQKKENLDVIE